MSTEMAREDVERLVRIEAKLDLSLQRAGEDREAHEQDMAEVRREADEVVKRVGALENWRYAVTAALIMSTGSTIAAAAQAVGK